MTLQGSLDLVSRHRIGGWARDLNRPDLKVSLVVMANGEVLARRLANGFRPDLQDASVGDGRHAFDLTLKRPLSPVTRYDISVRREEDGVHIPGSPFRLEATKTFSLDCQTEISGMLSNFTADKQDLERRLSFLTEEVNKLRKVHATCASEDGDVLRQHRRLGWTASGAPASAASVARRQALVIDDRLPVASRDAGSNAIISHMRSLRRLGYDVTFVPAALGGDASELEAEGVTCCLAPWYSCVEDVLRLHDNAFSLIYLHREGNASRYLALCRTYQPRARIIYSVADLHFLRFARQAEIEERPELLAASERMRVSETFAAWQADAVITHSRFEADLLGRYVAPDKIHVVPWAVPLRPCSTSFSERRGIAFVAGFAHQPNVDAANWLVDAIMPEVWKLNPAISCTLVGRDMPNSLHKLAGDRIEVLGAVADLKTVFDRVRLTVAPLAFGAGIKGKVLESMAAGIPCVCTPAAAEGLNFPANLERHVGRDPVELARSIVALHGDELLNRRLSDAGLSLVADFANDGRVDDLMSAAADAPKACRTPLDAAVVRLADGANEPAPARFGMSSTAR